MSKAFRQLVKNMSIEELKSKITQNKQESFKLRVKKVLEEVPHSHQAKAIRRQTARVMTELVARGVMLVKISRSKRK